MKVFLWILCTWNWKEKQKSWKWHINEKLIPKYEEKNVDYTGKQISKGFTSNQELSVQDSQCFTRPTNMFMKFYRMHVEEGLSVCVCIYLYAFILVYI